MTDYKEYINALRKCAKEHEKDRTYTGHIIVSDLCRDTANLLEMSDAIPVSFIQDRINECNSLAEKLSHQFGNERVSKEYLTEAAILDELLMAWRNKNE